MPDINPAELSRPAASLKTPLLATKSVTVPALKLAKASQLIPPRIDLEQAYVSLKASIDNAQWKRYKEATTNFLIGRLNQAEYAHCVDPILASPGGEREHLHNQLIAAIYGNVTREIPDPGVAPWVSATDKPSAAVASKPSSSDANERRVKGEVMMLPNKDRRRIKDLALNEVDPHDMLAGVFEQHRSKAPRAVEVPTSANGINRMNLDLEIRKRFAQPLAVESGEFPDTSNIESRMLPFCYEAGLVSGHAADAAQFMSVATETFIKEMLSAVFSRTRSNGPGEVGSAGFGGNHWVQTRRYRRQLAREEERASHGTLHRDKMGLLPIEAKKASDREPLGLAELRIALEMGDCALTQFPIVGHALMASYREGELEHWDDHTWIDGLGGLSGLGGLGGHGHPRLPAPATPPVGTVATGSSGGTAPATASVTVNGVTPTLAGDAAGSAGTASGSSATPGPAASGTAGGVAVSAPTAVTAASSLGIGEPSKAVVLPGPGVTPGNMSLSGATFANGLGGVDYSELMDVDGEEVWWDGAEGNDLDGLNTVLESCLAVG